MRALLLLVLLLAVIALVSFYQPAVLPYWGGRLSEIAALVGDGKFDEAWAVAMEPDPDIRYNKRSEPLGEAAPTSLSVSDADSVSTH